MSRDTATLLLRPDKAGDALKTLPALRALRAEFPMSEIHVLASAHNVSLFEYEPGIKLHVLPKDWQFQPKEKWLADLGFSSLFARFERVVSLLCDPSEELDLLLSVIPAGEKYTVHPASVAYTRLELPENTPAGRDESLNITLLLSQVFHADLVPRLPTMPRAPMLTPLDILEASDKLGHKEGRWLGICPLAGLAHRTLPLSRWPKFLNKVMAKREYTKYFLFGAPSDREPLELIRSSLKTCEGVELAFPASFRALGAYLQRMDRLVAVDSGPLHLARALNVPSLGILSGGDAKRWFHPIGEKNILVRRGLFQRYPSVFEMTRAFTAWKLS